VIPSDLSFGYLSAELKSPVKIPILSTLASLSNSAAIWPTRGYLGCGGEMRTTKIEGTFNGQSGRLARCCELWIAVE
jgi:hypothetical protein